MTQTRPRSATFETVVHKNEQRLTIRKTARKKLGLPSESGAVLQLVVRDSAGRILFKGVKEKKSGSEIYGKDVRQSGIRTGQRIVVTVWLAG